MKKKNKSKNWLIKNKRDIFFTKAKIHGYRSRSAFKLIEMNKKFKFLKRNSSLLDLGSSPGGWSQVASKKITNGKILAVDIKSMERISRVDFIKGNFCQKDIINKISNYFNYKKVDIILSDMAANTTGNKTLDSFNTGELCLNAMNLAEKILIKDGVFLSKVFMGSIFNEISKKAKKHFKKVINYKPLSSKKDSKEIYIFCEGFFRI